MGDTTNHEVWDFFISHASEDNESVAKPLEEALTKLGFRVWLDKIQMAAGDGLRRKIDEGLANHRVGVVIASSYFFGEGKHWTNAELDALLSRPGHSIVPLLYELTVQQLRAYSPLLAGKLVLNWQGPQKTADELVAILRAPKVAPVSTQRSRTLGPGNWREYDGLLALGSYAVPFVPFINVPGRDDIRPWPIDRIRVNRDGIKYELPKRHRATRIKPGAEDRPSGRLSSWRITDKALEVTLSETSYLDFLKSAEHLDEVIPKQQQTFREELGQLAGMDKNLRSNALICGVGIFVISQDGYVLLTKQPDESHIYPGRSTFSSSGSVKWGAWPHPFLEMVRHGFYEVGHQINLAEMSLISFGVDARKLFWTFVFIEHSGDRIQEIIRRVPKEAKPTRVPFELTPVIDELVKGCWEPSAEAGLLTLAVQSFGFSKVRKALEERTRELSRYRMREEWDYRALRFGDLPDLSLRYPLHRIDLKSRDYVEKVIQFLGSDVRGRRVVEVGSGTGRITKRLANRVRSLTCVDLSARMIGLNKKRVGSNSHVRYEQGFAQDLPVKEEFDVAVCSQVLIHNTDDSDFEAIVRTLCRAAESVFVFEDVSVTRETSPITKLRSATAIEEAFASHRFGVEKRRSYQLFGDQIAFLKFIRQRTVTSASRAG